MFRCSVSFVGCVFLLKIRNSHNSAEMVSFSFHFFCEKGAVSFCRANLSNCVNMVNNWWFTRLLLLMCACMFHEMWINILQLCPGPFCFSLLMCLKTLITFNKVPFALLTFTNTKGSGFFLHCTWHFTYNICDSILGFSLLRVIVDVAFLIVG